MDARAIAGRAIGYMWEGPSDLPAALRLEWRFVAVRWVGIVFMAPGLLLANLSPDLVMDAYAVLVAAAIYNLAIQHTIRRWPSLFASGYITTLGDGLLNIIMVTVGGGFDSPFYYMLFTVTISAAMRYGYGPANAMALLFVGFDLAEHFGADKVVSAPFIFRSGFLFITAILAGYLREQARRAEGALQERLRQANLLNEATAMLDASLDFELVLHAVAAAAAHLFGSDYAILEPSTNVDDESSDLPRVVRYPSSEQAPVHDELKTISNKYADRCFEPDWNGRSLHLESLRSGRQAAILVLGLPIRHVSLATLALALPPGQDVPPLARDILDSFVDRVTLAVENASLYRRLTDRTNDLQRAYADLAAAHEGLLRVDEMKTNFLANVSHELRTPLTSIRSFSELLLSYDDDKEVQREFLGVINSESERLTRLVNDVLDVVKIESGNMDWHITKVDIASVVRDTARTYATLIEKQGLVFEQDIADDLPRTYADRDRMHQVVGNLLNNAIKFTPSGTIRLTAKLVGDEIHISVTDTGIGIAAEDQERIFEKFQQVGAVMTDKPKGTGLGLAICKEIIDYHNGRLWVDSKTNVGSTFTVAIGVNTNPEQFALKVQPAA